MLNVNFFCCNFRVVVYTSYTDDEKKQVLQLYGQRSDEATSRNAYILCDIPSDVENPSILVTGKGNQKEARFCSHSTSSLTLVGTKPDNRSNKANTQNRLTNA